MTIKNISHKMILGLVLSSFINLNAQVDSNEQIAFDYFFNQIFLKEYSKENIYKINFKFKTEPSFSYFNYFKPCFDEQEFTFELNNPNSSSIPININRVKKIKFKKHITKFRVYVLRATKFQNNYFVLIEFSKKREFTDAYLLKINSQGDVINWCKTGVVW